ncbi:MAG TPA: T9SS type A sorting domain-containing protein [Candidatus Kryptonia bacterium]
MRNFVLYLLGLVLASTSSTYSQWVKLNGPYANGSAYGIINTDSLICMATYGDGIFVSTDNGNRWIRGNSGLADEYIQSLAILGKNLIAGSLQTGIYFSTDCGLHWKQSTGVTGLATDAQCLAVHDSTIFAGGVYLGYFSTDSGATWQQLGGQVGYNGADCYTFLDSEIYAGSWNDGIYRSTDEGLSWSGTANPPSFQISAMVTFGNKIFAGAVGGLYVSTDRASSWVSSDSGRMAGLVNCIVTDGSYIYVGSNSGGVYISADSGTTWTQTDLYKSNPDVFSLAVKDSTILAGTGLEGGLYRSTDKGRTWHQLNSGHTNLAVPAVAGCGPNLLAGTAGGGMYISTDSGSTWTQSMNGLQGGNVSCIIVRDSKVYLGTVSQGVSLSTDGGWSWNAFGLYGGFTIQSLAVNVSFLYAGLNGGVSYSDTQSAGWMYLGNGLTCTDVRTLATHNGNILAGTWGGGVFRTTGSTWTQVNNGLTYLGVSSLAVERSNVFAGTFDGGVFVTANDGTLWKQSDTGLRDTNIHSVITDGSDLFAATDSGIYVSTSENVAWFFAGLEEDTAYTLALVGSNIYAGTPAGIFRRPLTQLYALLLSPPILATPRNDSSGAVDSIKLAWRKVANATSYRIQLSSDSMFSRILVDSSSVLDTCLEVEGLKGDSVYFWRASALDTTGSSGWSDTWTFTAGPLTAVRPGKDIPTDFALHQNYPNPFNPTTVIKYQLPVSNYVSLKVYDVLGREVAVLVERKENAGAYNASFDGSNLPSGVYFYRLQAGAFKRVKKMILMR